MKNIIIVLCTVLTNAAGAQQILAPAAGLFDKKWIKTNQYAMDWYVLKDSTRVPLGKVATSVSVLKDVLVVATTVQLKGSTGVWIDSSVADKNNMRPYYHSSYNEHRDMVIQYGNRISGYFLDKQHNSRTNITDTSTGAFFDSNLYPTLIAWLPFRKKFRVKCSLYNYVSGSKGDRVTANVRVIRRENFGTRKSGKRKVWVVDVSDEMGASGQYYIDVQDRTLWKQTMVVGAQQMEMRREEDGYNDGWDE